jgi:MFS family permease
LLLSAVGVGGLAGALGLAAVGRRIRRGRLLTITALGYAVLLIAIAIVRTVALAVPLMLVTGCLMIVTNALGNGLLQALVPDEYRGRLMSIYSLIAVGLPQVIGAFGAGAIAKAVGVDWAIGGTAAVMLLYGAIAFRRYPEIRRI